MAARAQRGLGVVLGHEIESLGVLREQLGQGADGFFMLTTGDLHAAGQHVGAGGLRGGLAGIVEQRESLVDLLAGLGLQRQLAQVVCDADDEGAGAAFLELAGDLGGFAPIA